MQSLLIQSAKQALDVLMSSHPGLVTIDGTAYKCAAIVARGNIEDARGGFKQGKRAAFHLPYSAVQEADLIDATTGKNRRITITHDGDSYRLTDGGVNFDPLQTRWILRAEQAVN